MIDYALQPIGYVRNSCKEFEALPYGGASSILELREEYRNAAAGLQPGYIWVVTWLHHSERTHARATDRGVRGSFSSRTPVRLNPIGVTAARLLEIDGPRLYVDALDVIDGTPLLDVKPYVREFDCIFGPADPAWRRAARLEDRLARLVRTIERFCGPLTPQLALAARLALAVDRDLDTAANAPELTWECRCSLPIAAGIQAVSGAVLGSPRFDLGPDEGTVRARHRQQGTVAYRLRQIDGTPEQILAADERDLLRPEA